MLAYAYIFGCRQLHYIFTARFETLDEITNEVHSLSLTCLHNFRIQLMYTYFFLFLDSFNKKVSKTKMFPRNI